MCGGKFWNPGYYRVTSRSPERIVMRLVCLGRLAVATGDGAARGAAAQRRRLAVLAVLAVAGERGVSRDRLLALFWPETDEESARGALKQAVYALRRDLGFEDVIVGVTDLRLNPAVISVDLWEFERAVTEGRGADAVAVYGGPFLDGVHVSESVEFDQWASRERGRLAGAFQSVLEAQGRAASQAGDPVGAARYWRQLAALRPLDARIVLDAARAMAAVGDRAGALDLLRTHEDITRTELGIDVDSAVAGAMVELRKARNSGPTEAMPVGALDPSMPEAASDSAPTAGRASTRSRLGRSVIIGGSLAAVVLAPLLVGSFAGHRRARKSIRVAVLPFLYRGDTAYAYLGPGMVSVLSSTLDGAGPMRTVDARIVFAASAGPREVESAERSAQRMGADVTIAGEIVEAGGRLRLSATMTDHRSGRSQDASAEGAPRDFLVLVDRVAADLAADLGVGADAQLVHTAAATTTSYTALRAYLQGESAMRVGRYSEAVSHFRRAVEEDSLFAIAWYRLSIAGDWAADRQEDALAHTERLAARLPAREAALLRAYVAWASGNAADALDLARTVVDHYPNDVSAWYLLGEVIFHSGADFGVPLREARAPFEHVLSLDSSNADAMVHLARIAAREGRRAEAVRLTDRAISLASPDLVLELKGFRAWAAGDSAGEAATIAALETAGRRRAYNVAWRVAVFLGDLEGADRILHVMTDPSAPASMRAEGYSLRATVAFARGQWRGGLTLLDSAAANDSAEALIYRAWHLALPFAPDIGRERFAIESQLARTDFRRLGIRDSVTRVHAAAVAPFLLASLALRDGDEVAARRELDALRAAPFPDSLRSLREVFVAQLDAVRLAWRPQLGRPAPLPSPGAKALWGGTALGGILTSRVLVVYLQATALAAAGRGQAALPWLESLGQNEILETPYAGPALEAIAQIKRETGDRDGEREALRRFVVLWKDCDPELRPQVAAARARLTALGG